mmetsp:Transcript_14696/g.26458  ORF Transcript_14696/g.26458 Transcript_14696/m.26458 type:complete len:81 (-) Transcript_14696:961-1203(-)
MRGNIVRNVEINHLNLVNLTKKIRLFCPLLRRPYPLSFGAAEEDGSSSGKKNRNTIFDFQISESFDSVSRYAFRAFFLWF